MTVKVAIISFAHVHAPGHAEQLIRRRADKGDVEVVGVYDDDAERGKHYANRYGFRFFENLNELLKTKPDVVVIDSETSRHRRFVELAAESGAAIFCEKPVGINTADAVAIRDIVKRRGILFTTGFNSRFNPENAKAREIVQSGLIGRVSMIRVRVAHSAAIDKWFKGWSAWFAVSQYSGGGGFLDLGIHGADLMRFILGDDAVEAVGYVQNFTRSYDIDDEGIGVFRFSKGALGVLDAGWTQVVENMPWSPLEIYGDEGSVIRTEVGLIYYSRGRREWVKPNPARLGASNALDELINVVQSGGQLTVTVDDAVKAQEMIEAVYRSSVEGKAIKLPLSA